MDGLPSPTTRKLPSTLGCFMVGCVAGTRCDYRRQELSRYSVPWYKNRGESVRVFVPYRTAEIQAYFVSPHVPQGRLDRGKCVNTTQQIPCRRHALPSVPYREWPLPTASTVERVVVLRLNKKSIKENIHPGVGSVRWRWLLEGR